MNNDDIHILKSKNRIELVMQETGLSLEVDAANSDLWHGKTDDGFTVTVNIKKQMYELSRPGMDTKVNQDVIAWLMRRYSWTFPQARRFLKTRAPDPKQKTQPVKVKKPKQPQFQQSDYVTISNIYTDPETGMQSYGSNYNYSIMDDLQKRAIQVLENAHLNPDWIIDYFSKSSREILSELQKRPCRFTRIEDVSIDKCGRCEASFDWNLRDTYACAVQKEINIELDFDEEKKLNDAFGEIVVNAKEYRLGGFYLDSFWVIGDDDDDIFCPDCAFKARKRYTALRLCYRSAQRREDAEVEEQRQRDHEARLEEERERERENERMDYEAFLRDSAAREEIR